MFKKINDFCDQISKDFDSISIERKEILKKIAVYVQQKKDANDNINLVYICTHNSRRSHFGQVWASVAANYYHLKQVNAFSGGTEVTAFNPNAIAALQQIGFIVENDNTNNNPLHKVFYTDELFATCFSKVYDVVVNPNTNFAAIMTCGNAEKNCPYIPNTDLRIATTYTDPKTSDNTPLQNETYYLRCKQIATEVFYVFSLIK